MPRKRRGIALILALFTTAILIILSVSFLVLALGESRNSRTAGYEGAAVQAANFGIGYVINYMGRGGRVPTNASAGAGLTTWTSVQIPNQLGSINVLQQPVSFNYQGYPIRVRLSPDFPTNPNVRRVSIASLGSGAPLLIPAGRDLQFSFYVDIVPVSNQGIISYRLLSTSEVWGLPAGSQPLARRRIEVRVLEESVGSYLHFISNARSTNVQGQTSGEVDAGSDIPGSPGNIVAQRTIALAGNVRIPPDYIENGPMRVDGQVATGLNATNLFALASGNVIFGPGTNVDGDKPRFEEMLTINQLRNGYESSFGVLDPGIGDQNSGFFSGGLSPGTSSLGLPDFEKAKTLLRQAAQVSTKPQSVNGLIEFPTSTLMNGPTPQYQGRTTFNPGTPTPPTDEVAYVGNPFVERMESRVINGQTIKVPVEPDYRPRFPNVEISVVNDTVRVANVSTLDGSQLTPPKTFDLKQFESGVLFVEGGNVVITSGVNAIGQFTVVASERTDKPDPDPTKARVGRERQNATVINATIPKFDINRNVVSSGSTYNSTFHDAYNTTAVTGETLYSYAARQADTYFRAEAQSIAAGPPTVNGLSRQQRYNQLKTPPYSIQDLRDLRQARPDVITANVPADANVNRRFFPPPSTRLSPKAEREGNLIIAGDFNYNEGRGNTFGFLAQNFVLLNDRTPADNNRKLTINGVLMSGERSVQLDWDNTARQDRSAHQQLMAPGYGGTLVLKGSIVGEHIDVEGDYDRRGYFTQQFEHDRQLLQQRPPYFPRWDFSQLEGPFRFTITHHVDRGSLSTEGAAAAPSP